MSSGSTITSPTTLDTMLSQAADQSADVTDGPPVSISVPEWNVSLLAGILLSEEIGPSDGVQAVFELHLKRSEMNGLFVWDHGSSPSSVNFASDAKEHFKGYCQRQLYGGTGSGDNAITKTSIEPSLATHFLLSKSLLKLSAAMETTGIIKCNMVEEKILSVAHDIFNSTSAFTLFQPRSRILLANDYYIRGVEALNFIMDQMNTTSTGDQLATSIVTKVLSTRAMPSDITSGFSVFLVGDELTFNVVAVSSKSQYDIIPSANVDKNLSDRSYKYKIVVVDDGAEVTHIGTSVALSSIPVMGDTAATYKNVILNYPETLAPLVYSNDASDDGYYVDRFNTEITSTYDSVTLADGTEQF